MLLFSPNIPTMLEMIDKASETFTLLRWQDTLK